MPEFKLYLLGVLHKAAFILRHLCSIVCESVSEAVIVEVLYHELELGIDLNEEA